MPLNLANTVTITAKTALVNVTTVSANVLSNATSSGQIHKINTIMFNNYSAVSTTANVTINRATGDFFVARLIVVPANSILTVIELFSRNQRFFVHKKYVCTRNCI